MNGSSLDMYGAPVGNMCDGDPCELFTKHVKKSKYADKVPGRLFVPIAFSVPVLRNILCCCVCTLSGFQGSFEGPVVAMINRYCDSTCEGIAMGELTVLDKCGKRLDACGSFSI